MTGWLRMGYFSLFDLCVGAVIGANLFSFPSVSVAAEPRWDILVQGGRVVDGTGAPWYQADVGIREGKVSHVGRIDGEDARTVIDARGLIVAPGFIDMMGQTATPMLRDPASAMNLLTQGITTINAGEGQSAAPLAADEARSAGWQTMAEYFQMLDSKGLPVNVVQTVGHTQVRQLVLGDADRRPSDEEIRSMQGLVREGMEAGAIGLSTALIYPPAVYATTKEIGLLAEVAGQYGGRYYTHMRNEGDQLIEAIDEALAIGRMAKTPVHIFHLKAAGRNNWAKMQKAISRIESARTDGQQVTADIYPYVHNGLGIAALIHPRHFAAGRTRFLQRLDDAEYRKEIQHEIENTDGWENWYRHIGGDWNKLVIGFTGDKRYADLAGQTLAEIAKAHGEDPWETFFHLVRAGAFALPESMNEANKILAMQQEFVSFCTDVGPAGGSRIASHPRAFGSFPRLLARYVRQLGALSLERAVAQASAAAANDVMAYDRGRIAAGLAADLIVFDYETLTDQATFAEPNRLAEGMKYVIVNGQLVLKDGQQTGNRPGRVLRGPGYRHETAPHAVSSGDADPRMASFDTMMGRFMEEHRIPGAALAVTDQGRLVYARGFGYADVAAMEQVTANSLFRIASISKPITAVAILKLVEEEKLDLDEKVFEILDYEPHLVDSAEVDPRQAEITIRHLLGHRGGWDRGQSFDAMFQSVRFAEQLGRDPPAGPGDVIRCMLGVPLDFDPGQRYAYSNYGYCLLGRVIEVRTGQTYEQYVRQHVLAPLGIESMRIGETHREGRQPGEVCYYDPRTGPSVFAVDRGATVAAPYGQWYLEAMDAHGGWIASAVDLARFAAALDDANGEELLTRASIDHMHGRPAGETGFDDPNVYYSFGWSNRVVAEGKVNHWHTGSLPGTATILIRRHDGRNLVALFNTRVSPTANHLGREIDRLLHQAADAVSEWPEEDRF